MLMCSPYCNDGMLMVENLLCHGGKMQLWTDSCYHDSRMLMLTCSSYCCCFLTFVGIIYIYELVCIGVLFYFYFYWIFIPLRACMS